MPSADHDFRQQQEPDFSQIPATRDEHSWGGSQNGVSSAGPAWAERNTSLSRFEKTAKPLPARKRRLGRWLVGIFVIGSATCFFYMFRFQRPFVEGLLGDFLTSSDDNRYQKFFDRGREAFLLDSEAYYLRADREFQKVLALEEGHAPTLASLAETHAVWAQYLVDEQVDALLDAAKAKEGDAALREKAERLKSEVQERLAEASRWADQALRADPTLPAAHRAKAEVLRLLGETEQAAEHLAAAGDPGADPETAYASIMMNLERGVPTAELIHKLDTVIQQQTLIRAMYRKARFFASEGLAKAAEEEIARVLELNSEHQQARTLLERLKNKQPLALRLENAPAEPAPSEVAQGADDAKKPADPPKKDERSAQGSGGGLESLLKQAARNQKRGRTQNAIDLYEKALERDPGHTGALSGLAYCHLDRGASGKAIALFRRALQKDPRHGPTLIGLATTFKAQKQNELALKYFRQYLEAQPSGPQKGLAKRNIAQLESALAENAKKMASEERAASQAAVAAASEAPPSKEESEEPLGVELPDEAPADPPADDRAPSPPKDEPSSLPVDQAPTSPSDTEE